MTRLFIVLEPFSSSCTTSCTSEQKNTSVTLSNRAISLSKHHIILPSNDRATIWSCYSQHKKRLRGLDRWVWMRNKSKETVDNTVAKSVRVRPCRIVRTCRPVLSTEPDECVMCTGCPPVPLIQWVFYSNNGVCFWVSMMMAFLGFQRRCQRFLYRFMSRSESEIYGLWWTCARARAGVRVCVCVCVCQYLFG